MAKQVPRPAQTQGLYLLMKGAAKAHCMGGVGAAREIIVAIFANSLLQ